MKTINLVGIILPLGVLIFLFTLEFLGVGYSSQVNYANNVNISNITRLDGKIIGPSIITIKADNSFFFSRQVKLDYTICAFKNKEYKQDLSYEVYVNSIKSEDSFEANLAPYSKNTIEIRPYIYQSEYEDQKEKFWSIDNLVLYDLSNGYVYCWEDQDENKSLAKIEVLY